MKIHGNIKADILERSHHLKEANHLGEFPTFIAPGDGRHPSVSCWAAKPTLD